MAIGFRTTAAKADETSIKETIIQEEVFLREALEKPKEKVNKTIDLEKDKTEEEKEPAEVDKVEEVETVEREPIVEESYDYVWVKESFGSIQEEIIEDSNKDKGYVNLQEGKLGQKEVQIKIVYQNGVETSRFETGEEKIVSNPVNQIKTMGTKVPIVDDGNYLRAQASDLLFYVNEYRSSKGLDKFQASQEFNGLADIRVKESTQVFDHTRPNGTPWYTVSEKVLGENLAYGYSAKGTANAWINSTTGHREFLEKNNCFAGVSMYTNSDGNTYAVLLTGN